MDFDLTREQAQQIADFAGEKLGAAAQAPADDGLHVLLREQRSGVGLRLFRGVGRPLPGLLLLLRDVLDVQGLDGGVRSRDRPADPLHQAVDGPAVHRVHVGWRGVGLAHHRCQRLLHGLLDPVHRHHLLQLALRLKEGDHRLPVRLRGSAVEDDPAVHGGHGVRGDLHGARRAADHEALQFDGDHIRQRRVFGVLCAQVDPGLAERVLVQRADRVAGVERHAGDDGSAARLGRRKEGVAGRLFEHVEDHLFRSDEAKVGEDHAFFGVVVAQGNADLVDLPVRAQVVERFEPI